MIGDEAFAAMLEKLKKGMTLDLSGLAIKEGGNLAAQEVYFRFMILAMENAGQLIEDEELRAQIKGSGIGTSATRGGDPEKDS